MASYTKKAITGTMIITFITFLGAILGYLFRIILARKLTVYEYGVFYSVYSLLSLIFLIRDFGLGSAISKFVPEFLIKKDYKSLKLSLMLITVVTSSVSAALFIIIAILSNFISIYYLKDSHYGFFILLSGLMFALFSSDSLIVNILAAFQKHFLYSLFQLLRQGLCVLFLVILLMLNSSIYNILYSYLLTSLILLALFLIIFPKIHPTFKNIKLIYDKKLSKDMLKFGMSIIFVGVGGMILQYSDSIMLALYLNSTEVGIYNAAVPIYSMLIYIGAALTVVLVPLVSELWTKKLKSSIEYTIKTLYKYILLVFLPLCMIVILYSDVIIRLLFGPGYVAASLALKILMIGSLDYLMAQVNYSILIGIGNPEAVAKITLLGAGVNILINIILIPLFGINGAAITTTFGYFLMMILSTLLIGKNLRIKLPIVDWLKTLAISAIFILLMSFLKNIIVMNLYLEIMIVCAISGLTYVVLAFSIRLLDLDEIKNFIQKSRE